MFCFDCQHLKYEAVLTYFSELNGGNNNNALAYYVGPYCSPADGYSIYLGVFTDADCTAATNVNIFDTVNGYKLLCTSTSIVNSDCYSCLQADSNNSGAIQSVVKPTWTSHPRMKAVVTLSIASIEFPKLRRVLPPFVVYLDSIFSVLEVENVASSKEYSESMVVSSAY